MYRTAIQWRRLFRPRESNEGARDPHDPRSSVHRSQSPKELVSALVAALGCGGSLVEPGGRGGDATVKNLFLPLLNREGCYGMDGDR